MNYDELKENLELFSSPFIEERLYLETETFTKTKVLEFSSPFIEERLYLRRNEKWKI